MELLSVCPLRIAAAITSVGTFHELRAVVRATLELDGGGLLELSKQQPDPEIQDCAFLRVDEVEPSARSKRTWRHITGKDVGDGAHFTFEGAPPDLERTFLPDLRPRLFIEEAEGAREVMLERASVRLDLEARRFTVLWHGRGSLGKDELRGRAVVALERADDLVTWAELTARTRNLDEVFLRQRSRAEMRTADPRFHRVEDDTLSLSASEFANELEKAALPFSGDAAPEAPPQEAVAPAPPSPKSVPPMSPPAVEKRTIGQVLAERPTLAKSSPVRASEEPAPPLAMAVPPEKLGAPRAEVSPDSASGPSDDAPEDASVALDLVWSAEEAVARLRRDPTFKRYLGAARARSAAESRDARLVATVARTSPVTPLKSLRSALVQSVREGVIEPPLVIVSGFLELMFDPLETLRTLVTAVAPLARSHEKLNRAIESAKLVTEGPLSESAWMLAEPELASLREALASIPDKTSVNAIIDATSRKLTKDKKLLRETLSGEPHVVTQLTQSESTGGDRSRVAVVYLPEDAAARWPLTSRISALLIAEARPSPDDRDKTGVALFPITVYRSVAID